MSNGLNICHVAKTSKRQLYTDMLAITTLEGQVFLMHTFSGLSVSVNLFLSSSVFGRKSIYENFFDEYDK